MSIDGAAFHRCYSLQSIIIPSTVKKIGAQAFAQCHQLQTISFPENGEITDIHYATFSGCESILEIRIPNYIRAIREEAFEDCFMLRNVVLQEGLHELNMESFAYCVSLTSIQLPSTLHYIRNNPFEQCSNLLSIRFCAEIEDFIDELNIGDWWRNGTSTIAMKTGTFLARKNIHTRIASILKHEWKEYLHNMLRNIPENVLPIENVIMPLIQRFEIEYFNDIERQVLQYEDAQTKLPLLELALWNAMIAERKKSGEAINDKMKLETRNISVSMGKVIIPNVMLFLCRY